MSNLVSWTSLIAATVGLVLILLAFRVLGHFRLTFRFRGAVTVSPWAQKPCPHLGLLDEPFIHRDDPSEEHRCYLWMQRDRIDLTHQKGFCLSSAHTHCPWMSIAPPVGKAPVSRRLRVAGPLALSFISSHLSGALAGFLIWLIWRLRRAGLVARGWANAAVPVVVTLAVIAAHEIATRASAAGRTLASASMVAGRAILVWLKANAIHFGGLAKEAAREAWAARTTPAVKTASPPADRPNSFEIAGPVPLASPELPGPVPQPVAPGLRPVTERTGEGALSHLDNLVEQGKMAGMSGNRKLAYSLFSLALDLDPKNDEAWLWKGAMTDDAEDKLICLQQALAMNPNNRRAQQAFRQMAQGPLGTERESQGGIPAGDERAAGLLLERGRAYQAVVSASASEDTLISTALAALERGDEEGANRLFVRATEVSPGSEKAWFWRAKTSTTLNDVIYSLQKALTINPGNEKVRANLLWAIQRQQKEEAANQAERRLGEEKARAHPDEVKTHRSLVARGFRWLAAMVCLTLAGFWVSAAALPFLDLPLVQELSAEIQETTTIDLDGVRPLYDTAAGWLPELSWVSLPWHDRLEIASGYNLLAAVPYVVGFLYLFVAIGVARRENWSRFWALAATLLSLALSLLLATNQQGAALVTGLGFATILTLLLSRSEFGLGVEGQEAGVKGQGSGVGWSAEARWQ